MVIKHGHQLFAIVYGVSIYKAFEIVLGYRKYFISVCYYY